MRRGDAVLEEKIHYLSALLSTLLLENDNTVTAKWKKRKASVLDVSLLLWEEEKEREELCRTISSLSDLRFGRPLRMFVGASDMELFTRDLKSYL